MSGLYRRNRIWWLRTDPVTGGRRSTKCTSKKAALAYLAERERLAADPHYAASYQATVGGWAKELVAVKERGNPETATMYRIKIGHVVRIFGATAKMADVTPVNVDRFVAIRQGEGAVNNTIGKELTAISQMCKLAKRAGAYAGDVSALRPVGFKLNYTPRSGTISQEDAPKLFGALPLPRAALAALAVAVGGRRGEVQRIRPEDIDVDAWTVHIPGTKTKKSERTIPVTLPVQRALLRFALETGTLPVKWPRMSKDIPELCAKLGIPRVTPNDLRRSFATWGIEAGISREDTAKLMGHGSTAMVFQVYGRESAEAFGRKLQRDTGTESSQREPDGGTCSGAGGSESCVFSAVAPSRVELERSCEPGILSPARGVTGAREPQPFPAESRDGVTPDAAECRRVGTDSSQSRYLRALAWGWFRRAA